MNTLHSWKIIAGLGITLLGLMLLISAFIYRSRFKSLDVNAREERQSKVESNFIKLRNVGFALVGAGVSYVLIVVYEL